MLEPFENPVIAVDGGGTRCRIACATGRKTVRVETGSANVHTDFDGAVAQIRQGVSRLASLLGVVTSELTHMPAYVGLAGVTGPGIADRLRVALPFDSMRIEDDRPAALRGALGTIDGTVAHCGTGSFFACQKSGNIRFAGGWGAILGDEASAKWIGQSALSLLLKAHDRTVANSPWAAAMLADFGGVEPVLRFAASAKPDRLAALAPKVTGAAARGDALAASIMRAGADHIVQMIEAMGWTPEMALCLTGGVGPHYRDFLPDALRAAIRAPIGEPLDGALALAREMDHVES